MFELIIICVLSHFCVSVMLFCSPTVRRASSALMLWMVVVDSSSGSAHMFCVSVIGELSSFSVSFLLVFCG